MISALGRPFDLGMLYDRRSDKLILGKTLWSPDQLKAALNTVPKPYTNSDVFTENTIDDKTSALNIEASLKLSFLGGLINVEGAAKYLNDRKTSNHQSRVVLKFETTTMMKELTMEHLGRGKLQHPEVLEENIATDVVVGILYGAKAFMIFDKEVSVDESVKEVHGNMEVLVKALPGISVDGKGSVDINEDQKSKAEKMQCKMYGDFRTKESPTNFEEAVKVYKELPSLIGDNGENAVPVEVYLCPLSNIDSKGQRMVREISADLISKTCAVQEHVQSIVAECNDLLRNDVCSYFPTLKKQLSSFMNNVTRYKIFFQKKLLPLLPSIRGGGAEESELADVLQKKEASPFSKSRMDSWVEEKRKESKKLQGYVRILGETPVVNPEDVENETFDPEKEHVVCCTFRIASEEDDQILSMDAYLSGNDPPKLKHGTSLKIDDKSVNAKLRKTLKQFKELRSVNEDNDAVKFLATDEPLSRDSGRSPGAFINLYEDGQLEDEDFSSSPKPEKPKATDVRADVIEISWNDSNSSKNNIKEYKVQYKPKEETTSEWINHQVPCLEEVNQKASITGLQPATNYLFRVCSVRQIIVSEYSAAVAVTTKPTSPPGKPRVITTTVDSITIDFAKPDLISKDVKIEKYKIYWCQDGKSTQGSSMYTEDAITTFTIKNLQQGMSYVIQVTANCGDAGESIASLTSDLVTTPLVAPKFQTSKIVGLCELVEPPEGGKPAVYALPLSLVHEDRSRNLRKFEINVEQKKTSTRASSPPNKVIMFVGSTGSGKTTTVNAMINHVLGVNWKDPYRFVMIREASGNQGTQTIGNQAYSQTQFVSCYILHHHEGFKVPYTLTVVDTPGFGDTRGIEQDKKITEQIRTFFNTKGVAGIDHIDAICFLAQAGNPRLTPTQRYVFDRILSMFGKDIKKNIPVLFTFADGQKPQALSAMIEDGILDADSLYFKFNNSALFVDNSDPSDEDNFDRMFWRMGIKSFEMFFTNLAKLETRSLVLTKEVLEERAHLEVKVSGLQQKINRGISTLSRLQQEERIFNQHKADINANRNFTYTTTDDQRVQVELPSGQYVTNCCPCNYTCHYPCGIPRSEDKARCASMSNGYCTACPNKCHWSNHVNYQYRFETKSVVVKREYDNKKTLYNQAVKGQSKVEAVMNQLKEEFEQTQRIVLQFVAEMQRSLEKLSEIALRKDPLQQVDYLDLLIQSEKSQARPGWQERTDSLQKTRNRAEQLNRLARPDYDPWEEYREDEETRKFLQKSDEKSKPGVGQRFYNYVTGK